MKKSLARCVILSVVLSVCATSGCGLGPETVKIDQDKVWGVPENTILLCTDGLDNDGNGLKDCDDPNCQAEGTKDNPLPGQTVCPGVIVNGVWTPAENTIYTCSDGIDNDGNGYVDCQDNACKGLTVCCVPSGDENTQEACSDGIDNDCDGYVDCADYSCKGNSKAPDSVATLEAINYCSLLENPNGRVIVDENTLETCSDGIDNDGDGYVDCADYSCNGAGSSKDSIATKEAIEYCAIAETPENTEELCRDGKDNNLNGLIDCDDPGCKVFKHCHDAVPEPAPRPYNFDQLSHVEQMLILAAEKDVCTDGKDNNYNGLTDCGEYLCQILSVRSKKYEGDFAQFAFYKEYETMCSENTDATCSDGIDNDGDGNIDCDDLNCANTKLCIEKICSDNIDNNKNKLIDCDDPRCDETQYCAGKTPENTTEACSDGVDNSRNGLIDCEDPSCFTTEPCIETVCSDGKDNDGNKLTDCDDPLCAGSVYCQEKTPEGSEETCSDGEDNNRNGKKDCDDPACFKTKACIEKVCSDGKDNDEDNQIDCLDPDCAGIGKCAGTSDNPQDDKPEDNSGIPADQLAALDAALAGMAEPPARESDPAKDETGMGTMQYMLEYRSCTDGKDNDNNGKKDCEEDGCKKISEEFKELFKDNEEMKALIFDCK